LFALVGTLVEAELGRGLVRVLDRNVFHLLEEAHTIHVAFGGCHFYGSVFLDVGFLNSGFN